MSTVTSINRDNLQIARGNIGLTTKDASKKITVSKKDLVAEWENGDSLPNWTQVDKLAKLYNVSELLFFSKEFIKKHKTIVDLPFGLFCLHVLKNKHANSQ